MKGRRQKQIPYKRRRIRQHMYLNIAAFILFAVLAAVGMRIVHHALLENAQNAGVAIARSYASEESSNLAVYETLISFGAASMEKQISQGRTNEELLEWMEVYFRQLNTVLGDGVVDPYAVIEGALLAANPWEGDTGYDVSSTEWYRKAVEADGEVIFTDVYTDAIYDKPVITVAQKCSEADAVLAFDIFPENFSFQLELQKLTEGQSLFFCDSAGTIIYRQTDLNVPEEEIQAYVNGLIKKIDAGELSDYDDSIMDMDGERRAVYYSEMDNGWFSIVTVPYEGLLRSFSWLTIFFGVIFAVFLLGFGVMTWRDMRLGDRMRLADETVRVLGNSYYALYRIHYEQGIYEMIKGSDYVKKRIPPIGEYRELLRVFGEVAEPEAYKEFLESFSIENIRRLVSGRVRDFGGDFRRRFGEEYRWVNVRVLFDESLPPEEAVLCFRDVEQEKQRQLKERNLLKEALHSSRQNEIAKQNFFSNMSHDMRTPLNAIIGLSQLAVRCVDEPRKVSDYLEKIQTSSRQLLGLINDILDMSRLEQGKVSLNNREFELGACLDECLGAFDFQAETEHKTFRKEIHVKNIRLLGDSFRVTQILNNFLSNAFKFTGEGDEIRVSVTQLNEGEHAKFQFVVSDTGIGMSTDFMEHLFEPYAREIRFGVRQTVGSGLGMPITKNLIEQMNGEIYVESEPDKGSTFTVILPFTVIEEKTPSAVGSQPEEQPGDFLKGKKLLLAEDNELNMEIATELLSMAGALVIPAWDGTEAVEQFEKSAPYEFDAVLMDMKMPQMDGCEAARRIRSLPRPDAGDVPIIAVTANAFEDDMAAAAAAGMDAHIAKPIDFKLLGKTLKQLLKRRDGKKIEKI